MDSILSNIAMFALGLLSLSFLVFIHELGHFLVAKWNKVKVKTFSIGFGKKLLRFKKGETEYCISLIPFGGYVAMEGENPEDADSNDPNSFVSKSVGARAAIAFAGPFVNIAFAFLLLVGLYMKGVEEPESSRLIVGLVAPESAAEKAGILPGDMIFELDGRPTNGWDDFREQVGVRLGANVPLKLTRGADTLSLTLVPQEMIIPGKDSLADDIHMGVGEAGVYPRHRVVINGKPLAGSAAEKAGFLPGDTIVEIDRQRIFRYRDVVDLVNGSEGKPLTVTIHRGADTLEKELSALYSPEHGRYMIGIQMTYVMFKETHIVSRNFPDAVLKACGTSWKMTTSVFRYLKRMFQGQVKVDAMSGPVTIVAVMGNVWLSGFEDFLMILALISINLGIMNLLPLAITDGGILLFLFIEAVRGKAISQEKQAVIQKIAMALFIALFVFITFLDFGKIGLFLK